MIKLISAFLLMMCASGLAAQPQAPAEKDSRSAVVKKKAQEVG
jgi:hypothetical protein